MPTVGACLRKSRDTRNVTITRQPSEWSANRFDLRLIGLIAATFTGLVTAPVNERVFCLF